MFVFVLYLNFKLITYGDCKSRDKHYISKYPAFRRPKIKMIARPRSKHKKKYLKEYKATIRQELTVNSPVTASNPTCTVCSKLVGYDIFGLESMCEGFVPLFLPFNVFFLRSASSGSVNQ